MEERSLPTPKAPGSNQATSNFYKEHSLAVNCKGRKDKNKEMARHLKKDFTKNVKINSTQNLKANNKQKHS